MNELRVDWFNNSTATFINPVINPLQNLLKRSKLNQIKIKFMIYNCFCCWIEINRRKFNFSAFVFFNSTFSVIWYLKKTLVSSKRSLKMSLMLWNCVNWCEIFKDLNQSLMFYSLMTELMDFFAQLIQLCNSLHVL